MNKCKNVITGNNRPSLVLYNNPKLFQRSNDWTRCTIQSGMKNLIKISEIYLKKFNLITLSTP